MTSEEKPVLTGPRVTLRGARDTDVEARFRLGNSVEIQRMFGTDPGQIRELTMDAAKAWVESQKKEQYGWIIEADGALLGAVRLHTLNLVDLRANIAIGLLSEAHLNKGYGTETLRLLAGYAFDVMGLHRLTGRVLDFNARAVASYIKVGFKEEGRERESARIGDAWHDDIIIGLLSQDLERLP
ncbi:N-acetyltransferase [Aliishimia ponticola]|uniref:N-acetyltransferase n=1 Tax=Aliishimia ponticola TaxID=2499833 RepID=A0A4S4NFW2_9RHOB|nr:GNAT family protein [Aliishimia ponticola]THH38506.1 N-acetyltransferase [Aliishimia ponticola]